MTTHRTFSGKRALSVATAAAALLAVISVYAASAADDDEAAEDDVFVPTEDISEDIAIAFPVDI